MKDLRMTSAALLNSRRTPPPTPETASAEFFSSLTEPTCCVIQLRHEREGVVHQVVLDPAKVKDTDYGTIIRLGEWPGDEAAGWKYQSVIAIVAILGRAERGSHNEALVSPRG